MVLFFQLQLFENSKLMADANPCIIRYGSGQGSLQYSVFVCYIFCLSRVGVLFSRRICVEFLITTWRLDSMHTDGANGSQLLGLV